jgi:single-strand DNA-binding protein
MHINWNENRALLLGRMDQTPQLSHESRGVCYYTFPMVVPRLSGVEDRLNIVAPAPLLEGIPQQPGSLLQAAGEVRSFNNRSGVGSRLVISFFAKSLTPAAGPPTNELVLSGALCKPPTLRRTPLGREICDLMLAVNRRYGRADYLPCIAWGSLAVKCGELPVGQAIRLEGRLQSRAYTKLSEQGPQSRTAYEISIMQLELLSSPG